MRGFYIPDKKFNFYGIDEYDIPGALTDRIINKHNSYWNEDLDTKRVSIELRQSR
jgi:hypothetical protein